MSEQRDLPMERPSEGVAAPAQASTDMLGVLDQLIQSGRPVADLKAVLDMVREERVDEARRAYFAALAAFQAELETVPKTRPVHNNRGEHMYDFASLDDIVTHVRPLLLKHGLSYSWDSEHVSDMLSVTCKVRHAAGHCEQSTFSVPFKSGAPAMSDQQKVASALSYAKRYSLTSALGVSVGEPDNDGADGGDQEPVDDAQLGELTGLANDLAPDRHEAFLGYMGAERLEDITRGDFRKAMNALKAEHANRAKGGDV